MKTILLTGFPCAVAMPREAREPDIRLIARIAPDRVQGEVLEQYGDGPGPVGVRRLTESRVGHNDLGIGQVTTEPNRGRAALATGAHPSTHRRISTNGCDPARRRQMVTGADELSGLSGAARTAYAIARRTATVDIATAICALLGPTPPSVASRMALPEMIGHSGDDTGAAMRQDPDTAQTDDRGPPRRILRRAARETLCN